MIEILVSIPEQETKVTKNKKCLDNPILSRKLGMMPSTVYLASLSSVKQ